MPPLTLEYTGDQVATFSGRYAAGNSGGSLFPYAYSIYRVPEPHALALLAIGVLAGRLRRGVECHEKAWLAIWHLPTLRALK